MRRDVRACQRCGSGALRIPGLADGVLVGEAQELGKWACGRCGLTAVPLLFDSESERARFEALRKASAVPDWPLAG